MRVAQLLSPFTFAVRLLGRITATIVGSLRWTPPPWAERLRRNPRQLVGAVAFCAFGSYGVAQYYQWQEANRPRPRELVHLRTLKATVAAPPVPGWDGSKEQPIAQGVVVWFDGEAAPLDQVGKPTLAAARIEPEVAGKWTWSTAKELAFLPEAPFAAGTKFRVWLQPSGLAAHTQLETAELDFTTTPLKAELETQSFVTDPTDPTRHEALATVRFNQPVTRAEVLRCLKVDTISGNALFSDAATVIQNPQSGTRFHLRTPPASIPEREDFIRFRLSPDVLAQAGGAPLGHEFATKVTVPTRETGFRLADAKAALVPDADGEPQQFVFLQTTRAAQVADFAKRVEAWELPPRLPGDPSWNSVSVTPEVLARSERVPLEVVMDDSGAPHATMVAFRLRPRPPGALWVRVPHGVPAPGGFVLASDFGAVVMVPAFPKEVNVLGDGGVLALTGERRLSIKSRGFDHLRFTLGRVPAGQINHLVSQTGGNFQSPYFRGGTFGVENIARLQSSVTPIARKNDHEANYSSFDFGPELVRALAGDKDPARGLFFIEAEGVRPRAAKDGEADKEDPDPQWIALADDGSDLSWQDNQGTNDRRFVLLTDLGLVVKRAADGQRDVFVLSFEKRAPLAGVQITALARNGEPLAEATTDERGRAVLPALDGYQREKKPVAIVARQGSDLAFLPWAREDRAVELSRFAVDGVPACKPAQLEAFLFTERGVYRPGDSIRLGAIVRRRDWQGELAGVPLRAILRNATEQIVANVPATLGADGFVEVTLPTQETAPTGVWRIDLQRPRDGNSGFEHLARTQVRVEDFQPDRLKLAAKLNGDAGAGWLSPKDLAVALEVHTLFDLPAAERRITAKLRVAPGQPVFETWKGWHFHLPEMEPFESRETDLGERHTDAAGQATIPLALEAHTAPLLKVAVDLEAFEADGGRGVQGSVGALVSPHERLLGWKANGELGYISRDVPCSLRIIALSRDLQATAAPGLTRVLLETKRISVLAKQENGSLAYVSQERDEEIEQMDGSLPAGESVLPLPVGKAGRFRYEWRNAERTVVCAVDFNVVGPAEISRGLQRESELELALPKREWRAGEELEISVRAPYAGAGLITIERERVLAWKWFKADSASSIQHITVPEGIEGGAYVHVAFVRRLDSPEIFTNPLSVGVLPFRTSREHRRLTVELDAPKLVRPGSPLVIGVRTPRPGRVVIWAVDDGIHRVTNYKTPQPLSAFFQQPSLEVNTWQLLDLLLPEFSLVQKSRAYGGDGDGSLELKLGLNPFKRKRNAPVVYWSGIVECGPDRREFTYDVPDYFAGRINVMAVAVAPDALGATEVSTIVKGPFVLTPNAPVFAAPGDEFIASLTIANQTEPPIEQVEVSATFSENLELLEAPEPMVAIAPNMEQTVRFRVRVKPMLGNAEIRFAVGADANRVELASTLSVRPAAPPITRIESGWFRQDTHEVEVGRPLYQEYASREAMVSATPMGLAAGLGVYLRQFPHGCTEQTTSKAFPYLLTTAEARSAPARKEAEAAISHACGILVGRQRSDGGFGYWTHANGEDGLDPLTVYVAHFLTEARASGFDVPEVLHAGAMRRLKAMATVAVRSREDANVQAAAIYLLTRGGEVTTNYALNLADTLRREHRDQWHADASAGYLAGTWMLLKLEKEGRELMTLHRAASAQAQADKRRELTFYECGLSNAAQSFAVLCRHFPQMAGDLGYDDLRPITDPVQRGEFHTHSAAWTILALKSYTSLAKASALELSIAEQAGGTWRPLIGERFSLEATRIQFRRKRAPGGPDIGAWFQTVEFGFPKESPTKPETRGLEVFRGFRDEENRPVLEAKVGQTLHARLRVRNVNAQRLAHIALVDLLPAGFENAPHDLRPGLHALPGATYVDVREDRNLLFLDLAAGESRTFEWKVRPTCAGKFTVPAAFGEAMYDRAISGTGMASQISVIANER